MRKSYKGTQLKITINNNKKYRYPTITTQIYQEIRNDGDKKPTLANEYS